MKKYMKIFVALVTVLSVASIGTTIYADSTAPRGQSLGLSEKERQIRKGYSSILEKSNLNNNHSIQANGTSITLGESKSIKLLDQVLQLRDMDTNVRNSMNKYWNPINEHALNKIAERQAAEEEVVTQEVSVQETTIQPVSTGTPAPTAVAPAYQQYIEHNGAYYPFSQLAVDTGVAQNFIDNNPEAFGMWNGVTYATTMDVLFAHNYAAGVLVYNTAVGDTVTLHYASGETVSYQVQSKTVASVNDYYDSNSSLWQNVGTNFNLMIKTCYDVNVTDLVITLVRI
ncbi:hypothetical protein G7062_02040 [Erysipelothrix sp. HDW6C]|uniref:hypothetical protein n=1 Tax=Erysipelothrix sp. HDW6C TaxID=2714930 RepID=UPI00140CDDC3|nr:hypothetical protein [Erysipelothrix sp. HDW6C]QIK69136.1 hypothetical protein G7062_02040 [Erysipelothrix sp. HDW6C]